MFGSASGTQRIGSISVKSRIRQRRRGGRKELFLRTVTPLSHLYHTFHTGAISWMFGSASGTQRIGSMSVKSRIRQRRRDGPLVV